MQQTHTTMLLLVAALQLSTGALGLECKPLATRYNNVRQLSSHNSYDSDGIKPRIEEQLQLGIRSFEFDIHRKHFPFGGVYGPGEWGVFHNTDIFSGGDYCQTLSRCLTQVQVWHDKNPTHEPITLWLQLVDDWRPTHDPAALDAAVRSVLGDNLLLPSEVLQYCKGSTSLQAAVSKCGWPSLVALQGKFLVVLHGNDAAGDEYLKHGRHERSAVAFVAPDMVSPETPSYARWGDAVFYNVHNTDGLHLAAVVFNLGLIARVWRIDSQQEWSLAYASLAQHLATDHVRGEFAPPATDRCGKPFELITR